MRINPISPPSSVEKGNLVGGSDCYKKAVWYPLIGLAVILFIPESIVSDSKNLKWLIAGVGHWIPAISNLSAVSDFPLLTGLYLTVMWALLPLAVGWWLVKMPMVDTSPSTWLLLRGFMLVTLFIMLMGSIIYWFPYHPDERQLSLHAGRSGMFLAVITKSRLGTGLGLGAFFYVLALFIMGWLRTFWLCAIRLIRLFGISL